MTNPKYHLILARFGGAEYLTGLIHAMQSNGPLPQVIGLDSQALIKATENQHPHVGHYILNKIHNAAKKLQAKQDRLFNWKEHAQAIREGEMWNGHTKGIINLHLLWVPGHHNFAPNNMLMKKQRQLLRETPATISTFHSFLEKAYYTASQQLCGSPKQTLVKTMENFPTYKSSVINR